MSESKVDIEASLKMIAKADENPWVFEMHLECLIQPHVVQLKPGSRKYTICTPVHSNEVAADNMRFIVAARDPITGWEPTLLELKEARESSQAHLEAARLCGDELAEARAELKRRDEPVKPAMRRSGETICGDCEYRVYMDYKQCPNCGRPLDWSGK